MDSSAERRADGRPPGFRPVVPRRTQLLPQRLKAAGVPPDADPVIAWRRLREVEGARATVIDLYALAAAPRGLNPWELDPAERQALGRAATEQGWPGFELAAGSERSGDVLEIVDYDPRWPVRYEQWRDRLRSALGAAAVRIEHMGSTAVPGLAAKPIVDVLVSVPISTTKLPTRPRSKASACRFAAVTS